MSVRRLLAILLIVLGCLSTAAAVVALWSPSSLQPYYLPELPRIESHADLPASPAPAPGDPIGLVSVPRLGISSVVLEGEDQAALLLGVGHLSDTPVPWRDGNSVLAAHRDTFFRPLRDIRRNDVIRFSTADAELEYIVRETRIVEPTDLAVLEPTAVATLTLITCYPFDFIGSAPQRFIVIAERRPAEVAGTDS